MLVACWSAKGGSGTTVVAVALATVLSRSSPAGAVLADLAGDVPAVLGLPEPDGPGLLDWLAAGADVPVDALARIELAGPGGLRVLPRGRPAASPEAGSGGRGDVLAAVLAADPRPVVVDCGRVDAGDGSSAVVAAAAERSLLVLRPCFLGLRRAVDAPIRATGVVLLTDDARILGAADVEATLGIPVVARVRVNDAVARAVDAGLLAGRVPRTLIEDLRRAA